MMKNRILIFNFLLINLFAHSQVKDFGLWTSGSAKATVIEGLDFTVSPELRWDQDVTRLRNRFVDLKLKYNFDRDFFLLTAFRFGGVQRNSGWQPRRRFQLGGGYKWKLDEWSVTYTSRLQFSFDVQTERRDADQSSSWRNKLDLAYKGVKKMTFNYSLELFHGLAASEALEYQDWRMVWSAKRKILKKQYVELGFLVQRNRVPRIDEIDRVVLLSYQIDLN